MLSLGLHRCKAIFLLDFIQNFFDLIHRDNKIQKSICKVTQDKMCIYSFNISPQTIVQLCFSKQGFTRLKQIEVQLTAALHLPLDVVRRRKSLNLRIINHDFFDTVEEQTGVNTITLFIFTL